jgi:hypothetical protein
VGVCDAAAASRHAGCACRRSASHVVILLAKKYPHYKIVNFDKLDYCSSLKNLAEVESLPNYLFVKGDITSSDLVNFVLKVENVDTIMHFAAQTHVGTSGCVHSARRQRRIVCVALRVPRDVEVFAFACSVHRCVVCACCFLGCLQSRTRLLCFMPPPWYRTASRCGCCSRRARRCGCGCVRVRVTPLLAAAQTTPLATRSSSRRRTCSARTCCWRRRRWRASRGSST